MRYPFHRSLFRHLPGLIQPTAHSPKVILTVIFLGILASGLSASSPGALDIAFGIAGVNQKDLGADWQETRAVAVQPDGKILMVGKRGMNSPLSYDFLLIRYNADGTLDSGFGTNGIVTTDFYGLNEIANSVLVQPDGKILVGGSSAYAGIEPTGFKVARYMPDGSLDASFGTGGKAVATYLDYAVYNANMVLQSDGKVLLAGDDLNRNILMTRFNNDGSLDPGFGTAGQVALPNSIVFNAVGVLSTGKIVVAGYPGNGVDSLSVYGFNANGSVDTGFGTSGKFTRSYVNNTFLYEVVDTKLAIQPDDKIIVSGYFHNNSQAEYADILPPLTRLNPNGSLDTGFVPNSTNVSLAGCGSCTSEVKKILPLSTGKFYVVGNYGDFDTSFTGPSLSRYNANGTIDSSFGFHGTRFVRKVDWTYSVKGAALQPDGKLVIGATGTTNKGESGNAASDYLVFRVNTAPADTSKRGDFDGDHLTDLAVFRPSNRTWYVLNSSNSTVSTTFYGVSTDLPVPGDYNYDGKTDIAIYRPGSISAFWIKPSQPGNGLYSTNYGLTDDIPVSADYDGDGLTDVGIFRPSSSTWYLKYSSLSLRSSYVATVPFGISGDKPVTGDYDGDGLADVAVFRPSTGVWWVQRSSDLQVFAVNWGLSADRPVQADYDGDGKTDLAVFRSGVWYVLRSSDGNASILQWGLSDDIPVPGDYDGDGLADFGIFRPSEGNWYVRKSSDASFLIAHWGLSGDIPIPARYLPN